MGLPREIIDEIMRYNDLRTLKACSLTSRAFYSAARPFIHKRMALGMWSAVRGSSRRRLPHKVYSEQAEVFHARYLSAAEERGLLRYGYVREVRLDLGVSNPENVLQLRQLQALETVHTLTIRWPNLHKILPVFDRYFSQFIPTVRSLRLDGTWFQDADKLTELVCRFPHLDNLALVNSLFGMTDPDYYLGLPSALPLPEGHRSRQLLPLGGHLTINGLGPLVRCLLDIPGGIRFQSIEASCCLEDLAKLLVECSSTLEVLNIHCFEDSKPGIFTLAYQSTEGLPASLSLSGKASRIFCRPGMQRDS